MLTLPPKIREEFVQKWNTMEITIGNLDRSIAAAHTAGINRPIYDRVSLATNIPWEVIAVIHMRETSFRMDRHLANGDPLIARTVHVPSGIPVDIEPPYTFEQGAIAALEHALRGWNINPLEVEWDIPHALRFLECYNGLKYRAHPETSGDYGSPYLWAFTNHYKSGYYIADGHFDSNAVCKESGCAPVLCHLGDFQQWSIS